MGYYKQEAIKKFQEDISKNLANISNHYDGENEVFFEHHIAKLLEKADNLKTEFQILKATLEEIEKENEDIYEQCCSYNSEFSEWWETLEKIENLF